MITKVRSWVFSRKVHSSKRATFRLARLGGHGMSNIKSCDAFCSIDPSSRPSPDFKTFHSKIIPSIVSLSVVLYQYFTARAGTEPMFCKVHLTRTTCGSFDVLNSVLDAPIRKIGLSLSRNSVRRSSFDFSVSLSCFFASRVAENTAAPPTAMLAKAMTKLHRAEFALSEALSACRFVSRSC